MAGKFDKLRIKPKFKQGRGAVDADAIVNAMKDCWDDLAKAIDQNMTQAEQKEMLDHFNGLFEDADDLGNCLFGSYDEFEMRVNMLDS